MSNTSRIPVPLVVDPDTGAWSVDGQAMVLVPRHFWAFIQMECEKRFGIDAMRAVLHDATYKAAKVWCDREAKTHGLGGVDVFRHYLSRVSQRGFGRFTIETVDPARGTASIRLDNSVYVAEYGTHAGRKVCYMFASAFVGGMEYVADVAGHPLQLVAEEVQCASDGADHCRFVVRPGQ